MGQEKQMFIVLAIVSLTQLARAGTPTQGIDCECAGVGDYVSVRTSVAVWGTVGMGGMSPTGKYQVLNTPYVTGRHIVVKRVTDSKTLLEVNISDNSYYGFSPGDECFLYSYFAGLSPQFEYSALYNLSATPPPGSSLLAPVWIWSGVAGNSYRFSPHGHFLVAAGITGSADSWINLQLIDAATGVAKFTTILRPYLGGYSGPFSLWWTNTFDDLNDLFTNWPAPFNGPSVAGWAFGPDSTDRTFLYTYVASQTSVEMNLVNLSDAAWVLSRTFTYPGSIPASWKFSPCGDIIAVASANTSNGSDVQLYATADGSSLTTRSVSSLSPTFSVDASSHKVLFNSQNVVLAANAAGGACFDPSAVWVNFAYSGPERGTSIAPFNTLGEALSAVSPGGTIRIMSGQTSETATISKPVTLESYGGVATLGQ